MGKSEKNSNDEIVFPDETPVGEETVEEELQPVDGEPVNVVEVEIPQKYWEKRMWAGVVPIWRCLLCGEDLNCKDDAAVHIAGHFNLNEQGTILDQLVKEME